MGHFDERGQYHPRPSWTKIWVSRAGRRATWLETWATLIFVGLCLGVAALAVVAPRELLIVSLQGGKLTWAQIKYWMFHGIQMIQGGPQTAAAQRALAGLARQQAAWHAPVVVAARATLLGWWWLWGGLAAAAIVIGRIWAGLYSARIAQDTVLRGPRLGSRRELVWAITRVRRGELWVALARRADALEREIHRAREEGRSAWRQRILHRGLAWILDRFARPGRAPSVLSIAGVPLPEQIVHICDIAQTGAGKTTRNRHHVVQCRERGVRQIILDVKGDYTELFYRADHDLLLSPADSRCVHWSLFADLRAVTDYALVSAAWIPEPKGTGDPFFTTAARQVFAAMLEYLVKLKPRPTYEDLLALVQADYRSLAKTLAKYPETAVQAHLGAEKQAVGILATLQTHVLALRHLSSLPAEISLREWVRTGTGDLFIAAQVEHEEALRSVLSAVVTLVLSELMALPEAEYEAPPRVAVLLDELAALHPIPNLLKAFREVRSRGVLLRVGIQDYGVMQHYYGRDAIESMRNAFGALLVGRITGTDTQRYAEQAIGTQEVRVYEESEAVGEDVQDRITMQRRQDRRPVVLAAELGDLATHECYMRVFRYPIVPLIRTAPLALRPIAPRYLPRPGIEVIRGTEETHEPVLLPATDEASHPDAPPPPAPGTDAPASTAEPAGHPQADGGTEPPPAAAPPAPAQSGRRVSPLARVLGK